MTSQLGLIIAGVTVTLAGAIAMMRQADRELLARTIWGEARGEGMRGMEAVAAVIMNRAADPRWPNSVREVVLQPWQFSAWNANDPNRARMEAVTEADPTYRVALKIADQALAGDLSDITGGANHYHSINMTPPTWAARMVDLGRRGDHRFYRG